MSRIKIKVFQFWFIGCIFLLEAFASLNSNFDNLKWIDIDISSWGVTPELSIRHAKYNLVTKEVWIRLINNAGGMRHQAVIISSIPKQYRPLAEFSTYAGTATYQQTITTSTAWFQTLLQINANGTVVCHNSVDAVAYHHKLDFRYVAQ